MKIRTGVVAAVVLLPILLWPLAAQAQDASGMKILDTRAAGIPDPPPEDERDTTAKILAAMLGWFIKGGIALMNAGSKAFAYIISAQLNNKEVNTLWALVLSLANLGFLLALVTIALLTALRIEVGGGVQRLLPRLFLGALLVNFSLVICLAILDVVNIGVASLSLAFERGQPDRISEDTAAQINTLLGAEGASFEAKVQTVVGQDKSGWSEVTGKLITTLTVWLAAVALWIVVAFLALRYLMLMLLIGVSPVAYLALAWPNMGSIAAKWWGKFLAWAFLPLGVLVVLGLTLQFAEVMAGNPGLAPPAGASQVEAARLEAESNVVKAFLSAVIIVAGFITSVSVGMYSATAGGAMVTKLATRGARMAGKGLYAGTGARRVVREGRATFSRATEPIRKTMGWGEHSKFDEKGRLKKGKATAFGLGERLQRAVGVVTPGAGGRVQRQAGVDAKNIRDNIAAPGLITQSALRNPETAKRLTSGEVGTLTANVVALGDPTKTINLTSNIEIVRKMDAAAQAAVFASGDIEAIKALNNSLRTIAQQET